MSLFRASLEACEAFVSSHSAMGKSTVLCVTEEEVAECQGQIVHQHPPVTPNWQITAMKTEERKKTGGRWNRVGMSVRETV